MFTSKFDLYKSGWLELVFDDRNKEYGAYDLRRHYADNMIKAMGITFLSIALLFISYGVLVKPREPVEILNVVPVTLDHFIVAKPPKVEPPKPIIHQTPKPPAQVATIRDAPLTVVRDEIADNPPKTVDLTKAAIGPQTVKGPETTGNSPVKSVGPGGVGPGTTVNSNDPVGTGDLDMMPEPFGGAVAWSKFLQKNILYPGQAAEEGKQGRVWLSFIIERDGHLSNIVVEHGAGFGLDEEALRVLKLAPAWKPGKQNGQTVRVKYTMPVNFVIPDPDN